MASPRLCSIEDCGKPARTRGWCQKHYDRWWIHGDPMKVLGTERGTARNFFLEAVYRYEDDDCLIWPFSRAKNGRARMTVNGKTVLVHRAVCDAVNGPPPTPSHEAAHSCGNGHKGCINKRHLRWATHKENAADMVGHGRSTRGERHARAKLNRADVRLIRTLAASTRHEDIAGRFHISAKHVEMIVRGGRWAWLSD